MNLEKYIVNIPDYPKPGVQFKDISRLLEDKDAFKFCIQKMSELVNSMDANLILGPEARGFIFGAATALQSDKGFVVVRKPGKLPRKTISIDYDLEYGTNTLEIHKDSIKTGDKVIIIDDILATGGTVEATAKLAEKAGATVEGIIFLIELKDLGGVKKLSKYNVKSLMKF